MKGNTEVKGYHTLYRAANICRVPIIYRIENVAEFRDSLKVNDMVTVINEEGEQVTARIKAKYRNICLTDKGCFSWQELMVAKGK